MGKLFIISGPSGSGKTTLVESLLASWHNADHTLARVVTFTTRPPRPQERDGIDYHFITDEEFKAQEQKGFFLETSRFCGYWYGSPVSILELLSKGALSLVLILDQEGAQALKGRESVVCIWIMPPNEQELLARLQNRDGSSTLRSEIALRELQEEKVSDFFDYHLVNNELKTAVFELKSMILSLIFNDDQQV